MQPLLSLIATTLAPSICAFSQAYIATLPEPEIVTVLPSKDCPPLAFNISLIKYIRPYPVASVLANDPPYSIPFPVKTPPSYLSFIRLYCPYKYPISRAPTPISPAGTSTSGPICLCSSVMKL